MSSVFKSFFGAPAAKPASEQAAAKPPKKANKNRLNSMMNKIQGGQKAAKADKAEKQRARQEWAGSELHEGPDGYDSGGDKFDDALADDFSLNINNNNNNNNNNNQATIEIINQQGTDSELESNNISPSSSYMLDSKHDLVLPEEQCDIPTFLHTKNCDPSLIQETRRLLAERYTKSSDGFYDDDYARMMNDDWTVTRFLLRRRLDPKRTAKLMEECGRFRRQYKMSEVKLWEFPIEFHRAGGLFQYAPDRVGNVTLYMRVKMYRRVPEISDVFKAFILCVLEECDRANNGRGTAVIFDLSSCGLQNVDLGFLSWLLSSFRNYCPKGVSYIIVYNLPWILNATCKLAMSWMSASNKRALRFVHGHEIENFISRDNLPDYLGGSCKLDYRRAPPGSRPAIEVCEQLDMTPEQALKIRQLFKEYLPEEERDDDFVYTYDTSDGCGVGQVAADGDQPPAVAPSDKSPDQNKSQLSGHHQSPGGARQARLAVGAKPAAHALNRELVETASKFIA